MAKHRAYGHRVKSVDKLTEKQAKNALAEIQEILWTHIADSSLDMGQIVWDPDTEWGTEEIEDVARVLDNLGLRPKEVTERYTEKS